MKPAKNLIIVSSGSVATIKLGALAQEFRKPESPYIFNIKIVVTEKAKHFLRREEIPADVPVLEDKDEWSSWNNRGDPVLHIDLSNWADVLLIAPLGANTMAKMVTGLCDNLALCIVRAWNMNKPVFFCPAMNTQMYLHPLTLTQIGKLQEWGYYEIPCIVKTLMCGETGNGAMAEVETIVTTILSYYKVKSEKCTVHSNNSFLA